MLQRQMPPFQQPIYMQQQRSYPTEMMRMPPMQMPQKRQGFLSKLLGRNRRATYDAFPMNWQAPFPQEMMTNSPQAFSQYQQQTNVPMNRQAPFPQGMMTNSPQAFSQFRQQDVPMMNPYSNPIRMSSEGASRVSSTVAAGKSAGGLGSFFSNILANPSSMIGNVEKVVKAAQTVGPVVQQYGPIIKNFPNLTKMLSSLPKKDPAAISATPVDNIQEVPIIEEKHTATTKQQKAEVGKEQTITEKRDPINRPKLYV